MAAATGTERRRHYRCGPTLLVPVQPSKGAYAPISTITRDISATIEKYDFIRAEQ